MTEGKIHRFYVTLADKKQWYAVMREARLWFGPNWKGQGKVLKKFTMFKTVRVWFDVPDPKWATWIATKLAVQVSSETKENSGK